MNVLSRRNVFALFYLLSTEQSIDDFVDLICEFTPHEFRLAVQQSSRLLYRGESVSVPSILHPDPDLLMENTYAEVSALSYFNCLERRLDSFAKPSTGHIGTSKYSDAASWGGVVSVWPLGNRLSYVYPRYSNLFFPTRQCNDELVVDQHLVAALTYGREVMFASWFDNDVRGLPLEISSLWKSAFVAIPASYEAQLLEGLCRRNYGI